MFEQLKEQPADKILALMQAFKEDPREDKIDLGVGVYKDAQGKTPIMRAIKSAEKQLWEEETTKAYTGLAGDPLFGERMAQLVLGDAVDGGKVHGHFPGLGVDDLYQGRDLPVTTDFRAVFSEVAGRHFTLDDSAALFPGWRGEPLPLLRRS